MEVVRDLSAATPHSAELIARARAMTPVLAKRSPEQRKRRQVLPETVAEMQQAGFFRVLQPRRWGGYEMDLHTFYDIQLALAEGDMSTAWIFGVLGVHPWFMALLDDRAAQEVWGADTSTLICSSLMPAGKASVTDGGFRLSGHWRYASGCEHCDWALLGALVQSTTGGPPEGRIFLVPRKDYRTVDTWQVAGLQGTGSIDVILDDDVFVPAYRTQAHVGQLQARWGGPIGELVEPLSAAVRTDLRARHLDQRARRLAGHAHGISGLRQDARDARRRPFGGKSDGATALRRDRGSNR